MARRRRILSGIITGAVISFSGCAGVLEDEENMDEEYDEVLDTYGGGETEFSNAMEDFERGEEIFREGRYSDAEIRFRDAERGFQSALKSFQDANSLLRDLEEKSAVLGNSKEMVSNAVQTATKFEWYANNHEEDAIQAQSDSNMGEMYFEATQQTIEDEGFSHSVPSKTDLMGEFVE